jgi:N-glycosidase YbiA
MNNSMESVKFYSVTDEYGEFSNFSENEIIIDGKRWPTSEHYFQAMKFEDKIYIEKIRKTKKPSIAAQMSRDRSVKIKRGWDSMRVNVMTIAVRAKFFTQHQHLRKLLLSTGDRKIIEHTANDDYWGDGGDGSGKNMLGIVLMKIRDELLRELRIEN